MGSSTRTCPGVDPCVAGSDDPSVRDAGDPHVPQPETPTAELHPSTRRARRMAGARRRAQTWRDRRAAELAALQAAAAEVEALRARVAVDAALVDALVERHLQLREETGHRAPAVPVGDVIRLARQSLAPGLPEAEAAIRDRLGAALARPAAGNGP